MRNMNTNRENAVIDNFVDYIGNNTIYDQERLRIIEWLNYGGHDRLQMFIDSRDDREPFAAIGKYYLDLYWSHRDLDAEDCVRFRKRLKAALETVPKLQLYA